MAEREQLLELVDDDHGGVVRRADLGRRRLRVGPRDRDDDLQATVTQRGSDAGADE